MSTLFSLIVSCALARAHDVTIKVDLSALPDEADRNTGHWILKQANTTFEAEGHQVTEDADHVVNVAISWYGENGASTLLTVQLDDKEPTEIRCDVCKDSKWLALLGAEFARVAKVLEEPVADEQPAPAPVEHTVVGPAENRPSEARQPTVEVEVEQDTAPPPLTWLGGGGIALGLGGVGLFVAGAIDVAAGQQQTLDTSAPNELLTQDFRARGVPLSVAGGLAVAGGITMLVVDLKRQTKKRRAVTVQPRAGRTVLGVQLRGRF